MVDEVVVAASQEALASLVDEAVAAAVAKDLSPGLSAFVSLLASV